MGLAPEPGIGARLAAQAEPDEPETIITGVSLDAGVTYFEFDLETVFDDEAIALEDAFDMAWGEFLTSLRRGSVKAHRAMLWLAQHRDNPDLTPADISYHALDFRVRTEERAAPLSEAGDNNEPATSEFSPTSSVSACGMALPHHQRCRPAHRLPRSALEKRAAMPGSTSHIDTSDLHKMGLGFWSRVDFRSRKRRSVGRCAKAAWSSRWKPARCRRGRRIPQYPHRWRFSAHADPCWWWQRPTWPC